MTLSVRLGPLGGFLGEDDPGFGAGPVLAADLRRGAQRLKGRDGGVLLGPDQLGGSCLFGDRQLDRFRIVGSGRRALLDDLAGGRNPGHLLHLHRIARQTCFGENRQRLVAIGSPHIGQVDNVVLGREGGAGRHRGGTGTLGDLLRQAHRGWIGGQ